MARIWMSGLGAGHVQVFDSSGGATISAAQMRTGAYSLYISDSNRYAASSLPASVTEVFARFGMRASFSDYMLLILFDNAGSPQISLTLNLTAHTLEVRTGAYTGAVLARGGEIHQSRWHCIEFHLVVDNAAGVFQLKVDGTQVINFAGDTQATANADVASFRFGFYVISDGEVCYYDDIAFNDNSGGVNDSWIGRGGIPAIFPVGAGASTDLDLFPNTGEANWEDVDEVPPDDDTSYVFDDLIDDHDSYEMDDLAVAGTVSAVQWLARVKSDLVGNPEIMRVLRIGGVDYDGAADIAIDADYDYYTEILDQDPDAGPGAWTVAAINGMEAGVKIR